VKPVNQTRQCRTAGQKLIAARRFIPKQEHHNKLMCRLAVGDEPPGGFWKNPETPMQQYVKSVQ